MVYQIVKNKVLIACTMLLCLCVFIVGFSGKGNKQKGKDNLNFKQILLVQDNKVEAGYEYGKECFPEYSFHGLPETFLLKKAADISFSPSQVESIEIRRMPYIPPTMLNFQIIINFDKLGSKKLYAYTTKMVNKRVALEAGSKVFNVVTIMEPIENGHISFSLIEKPFTEVRDILSKLTDNIVTENIREEEKR